MFGTKNTVACKLGHKSVYFRRMGHKRKHTRGKLQFLNTHFPNSVPVNTVDRLKKPDTSSKLGE